MIVIRVGIGVLVTFAVLAHGAVESWSEAVLEIGAALLLFWWVSRTLVNPDLGLKWHPLLWPSVGYWMVGAVQLTFGIGVYPFLTHIELLKYTALLVLFFLWVQSYRTPEHWRRFTWFLLVLGFAVSLFAIVQHFTFNGKLYWIRELRYGGIPFGPYVNRNHFAGLMELLIPPGLALLLVGNEDRDRLPIIALFTLIPVGALFLAASRGGIVSFVVETALLAVLVVLHRKQAKALAPAMLVLVVGVALVSWLGVGRAIERFNTYKALEVTDNRRVSMLRGTWKIFLDHPVIGTGLGTLQEVFPLYETAYDGKIVNHAHNDYAEALAETGTVGGLCALGFVVFLLGIGWRLITADSEQALFAYHAGALSACVGLLVHATVDFNFHIPSNALIFLLLAGLATSASPDRAYTFWGGPPKR